MAMVRTGNWFWEYYPSPYQFAFKGLPAPMPAPRLVATGLGCGGDSCKCGGKCGGHGVGAGVGLFDSSDITEWGWAEGLAIVGGLYLAASLFGDTRKVARTVSRSVKQSSAKRARAEQLRRELAGLR